jgi:hypothetical protein
LGNSGAEKEMNAITKMYNELFQLNELLKKWKREKHFQKEIDLLVIRRNQLASKILRASIQP